MRPPRLRRPTAILLCAIAVAAPGPAAVAQADVAQLLSGGARHQGDVRPDHVRDIGLIDGGPLPDGGYLAAIAIALDPGWYTYWRTPGASGIAPSFDWTGSENLSAVAYEWPRPQILDVGGGPTFGFKDALVLPVVLRPNRQDAAIDATLEMFFGVCNDICIPAKARLTARFDRGAAPAPAARAAIAAALAARPTEARAAGVASARCSVRPDVAGLSIAAEITFEAPTAPGFLTVMEAADRPDIWFGAAETRSEGRHVRATARIGGAGPGGVAFDRQGLRLTLLDAGRAIDIQGCPSE